MRNLGRLALGGVVLAAWTGRAAADSFVEGAVGITAPFEDSEYDSHVNNSLKLGVRAGSMVRSGGGVELALDFTPYDDDLGSFSGPFAAADGGVWRFRGLFAGRYTVPVNKTAHLYARAGAGIDLVHVDVHGNVLGNNFENTETDVGLALEVAGGMNVDIGKLRLGATIGVPMGFHFNDDDPDVNDDFDLEYNAYDFDFLVTVGTGM